MLWLCRPNTSKVEDETHFLIECELYKQFTNLRTCFLNDINFIHQKTIDEKYTTLMSTNSIEINNKLACFVYNLYQKRQNILDRLAKQDMLLST